MKTSVSWSPAPSLNVVSVQRGEQAWTVTVDSRQPTSCPGCSTQSKSRHSAYSRTLRDLSAQGAPVIINVRLARWRCRNQRCDRRIFAERLSVLRRRSPAGPPAWLVSFGCLAIARTGGPRSG
jgi:transposase